MVWLKDQVLRPGVVLDDEALVRYPLGIPSIVISLVSDHLVEKEVVMVKEMIAPTMKEKVVMA